MISSHPEGDAAHFEEGLVHLTDMLALADPRRPPPKDGVAHPLPVAVTTYDEWRAFCLDVTKTLEASRAKATDQTSLTTISAAIARIQRMLT